MADPELSGVTIVGAGSFNPAIVHPSWLAERNLISKELADLAVLSAAQQELVVSSQVAAFNANWLTVQITQNQAMFATVDKARELELRNLAEGFFKSLPETPVAAIGINCDSHFRAADENVWHEVGDRYLPKDPWEELVEDGDWVARDGGAHVGLRSVKVETSRREKPREFFVRIEVAPSQRITPNGVYLGINSHFQLPSAPPSKARDAAALLMREWDATRDIENSIVRRFGGQL